MKILLPAVFQINSKSLLRLCSKRKMGKERAMGKHLLLCTFPSFHTFRNHTNIPPRSLARPQVLLHTIHPSMCHGQVGVTTTTVQHLQLYNTPPKTHYGHHRYNARCEGTRVQSNCIPKSHGKTKCFIGLRMRIV